jgi:predicted anti-sigma-YlaC factor YlaD
MFSCRRVSRLLSDRLDRSLSWLERFAVRFHLLGCGPCCRFARTVQSLRTALSEGGDNAQLSPEAKERLRLALDEAVRGE